MARLSCWDIEDPSIYEATHDWKGKAYVFFVEYTDAMGNEQCLAQFLSDLVLQSMGTANFELIASTIRDRTGIISITAEHIVDAFSKSLPVSEYQK